MLLLLFFFIHIIAPQGLIKFHLPIKAISCILTSFTVWHKVVCLQFSSPRILPLSSLFKQGQQQPAVLTSVVSFTKQLQACWTQLQWDGRNSGRLESSLCHPVLMHKSWAVPRASGNLPEELHGFLILLQVRHFAYIMESKSQIYGITITVLFWSSRSPSTYAAFLITGDTWTDIVTVGDSTVIQEHKALVMSAFQSTNLVTTKRLF